MTALGASVGSIEVMQRHILNDFLLLVDVSLRDGNVLLGLEIVLGGIGVGSAHALDSATCSLDVDHITDGDLLFLNVLVYARIELELLLSLSGLETHNDRADDLAIAAMRVFDFLWGNLSDFSFPNLLGLLDSEADSSSEVFHENFRLLDLGTVDL